MFFDGVKVMIEPCFVHDDAQRQGVWWGRGAREQLLTTDNSSSWLVPWSAPVSQSFSHGNLYHLVTHPIRVRVLPELDTIMSMK